MSPLLRRRGFLRGLLIFPVLMTAQSIHACDPSDVDCNEDSSIQTYPAKGKLHENRYDTSAVGKLLFFAWEYEAPGDFYAINGDLYAINPDGSGTLRITEGLSHDSGYGGIAHPVWASFSPDGKTIAYHLLEKDASGGDPTFDLFVMNEDGSNVQRLTDTASSEIYPQWSPDGKHLLFLDWVKDEKTKWGYAQRLFVMNLDGTERRRLSSKHSILFSPSWSPDGSWIVYTRIAVHEEVVEDIFIKSADGTTTRRITNSPKKIKSSPTWSADGESIVIVQETHHPAYRRNHYDLFLFDLLGKKRHLTDTPRFNECCPSFSPDGSLVSFVRSTPTPSLNVIAPDGSGERTLVGQGQFSSIFTPILWAADSTALAFSDYHNLFKVSVNDGAVTQLTDDSLSKTLMSWQVLPLTTAYENLRTPTSSFDHSPH